MKPTLLLCPLLFALMGCRHETPPTPKDPAAFLRWAMDRYADASSMQANVEVISQTSSGRGVSQTRTVRYEKPNKFRVEVKSSEGTQIEAISDGSQEADYDNLKTSTSSLTSSAPAQISLAASKDMTDPTLCGSPVYYFFGGSANFDHLVKGPVKILEDKVSPEGEPVHILSFDTPGEVRNVRAVVGVRTGFVYALAYEYPPAKSRIVEMYMSIKMGGSLSRGSFDPSVPGAAALASLPAVRPGEDTPLPLGEPAPDATFKTLQGQEVSLNQLKGHPVFIDFWATWCGPCRLALPDTASYQAREDQNGLRVLAVTDEDPLTIRKFLGGQSYKLTAVRDEGDVAQRSFKVGGLPSEVILDAKGKVSSYLVGYHPPAEVRAALRKAGAKF